MYVRLNEFDSSIVRLYFDSMFLDVDPPVNNEIVTSPMMGLVFITLHIERKLSFVG